MQSDRRLISVVVPVHDEAPCLVPLYEELDRHTAELPYDFEFLFVDDGSTDDSGALLESLHERDPRVKSITFSRNYGHQIALTAGSYAARGDAVIHMDGDLQHPPAVIREFLSHWERGAQIVETRKLGTPQYPWHKALLTRAFYRLFNRISEIQIDPLASDFRLLDRRAVDAMNAYPDHDRFLRGITQSIGFRREVVSFEPDARFAGRSKYTYRKMSRLALVGLFGFTKLPLQLSLLLGAVLILLSLIHLAFGVAFYLLPGGYNVIRGWTSLALLITLLGGVNLLCIGVVGVYVAQTFDQVRQRPLFLVQRTIGIEELEPRPRAGRP